MAYLNASLINTCNYIPTIEGQIEAKQTPNAAYGNCPSLTVYTAYPPVSGNYLFAPNTIQNLQSHETTSCGSIPTGAFAGNDGYMYEFYQTDIWTNPTTGHWTATKSLLARSTQPISQWSSTNPPSFSWDYDVSTFNTTTLTGGLFIHNPTVKMTQPQLISLGLLQYLPPTFQNLPSTGSVVFVFGAPAGSANIYLAAVRMKDVTEATSGGPTNWWYFSGDVTKGTVGWSTVESAATSLFPAVTLPAGIDDHSVAWDPNFNRFVLMGGYGSINILFSPTPWGPWSGAQKIFAANNTWGTRIMHHTGDEIVEQPTPVYQNTGSQLATFYEDGATGVPYGAKILGHDVVNPDGSITMFFTTSMWVPYQSFLMSVTFRP